MNTIEKVQPRKKAQQFRSKETVRAIVQAASKILVEEGVKGFNTNNIAKRAGVSIGSLYQYFPNKDSISSLLFEEFFADQIAISVKHIELATSWDTLEEKIYDAIKEIYNYRLSDKIINRQVALQISNGLFNQLMLEKKVELSRSLLDVLSLNLHIAKTDKNFALLNLLVDSIDSMVFNIYEVELGTNFDEKFRFISKMIYQGVRNLDQQSLS